MSLLAEETLAAGEVAELLSDLLDRMLGGHAPEGSEARPPSILLRDQLTGERAVADVLEQFLHRRLHMLVDDDLATGEIAVFGDVGDRVTYIREAALVDQIHDQLHLVDALVVGDLGLIAGVHECLEAGLHERADTAAENGLLAEEVALGLLCEGRREHARAAAADRGTVGEREVEGVAARVLGHGDEARSAGAGLEELAHAVAGALGRDHDHVVARAGLDLAEVDVEAVREENRGTGLEVRLDLALEDTLLHMIGQEDRDKAGALYGGGNRLHVQPGLRGRPRVAPEAQADLDVDT